MKRLSTKEFAALVGCTEKLLEGLRRGKKPKFSPAYREKNRCYYTDDQITVFKETYAPKNVVISDGTAQGATAEDNNEASAQIVTSDVTDKQTRIDEATKFFNQLYGQITAPHFVYLIKFAGGIETYSFTVNDATQLAAMAQKAVELADSGVDIWHSVNPVCIKPHYEFDEDKKKIVLKRGDKTTVSYQTALICDVDIKSDAHKDTNLVATFDEARACLPFTPSLLVDSGFGLHAYYIFDTPLAITEDNREEINRRIKRLFDVIRTKANGKKIDGVGDLPRILRTPGTFNYKLGKDNAPLCHVVEDTGLRFTPADIDERLNAFDITPTPKPARTLDVTFDDNDADLKEFRIRRMLDCISVADGEYEKWFNVGTALYNEFGGSNEGLALWEQWSSTQPEYTPDKPGYSCSDKWKTFHYDPNGYAVGTLYQYATEGGYDEKDTQHEYYQLYPEKSKRNQNGSAQIEDLRAELTDKNNQLAVFEDEKKKALAKFNDEILTLETFDATTLSADDVINCVAIVRLYEPEGYTSLRQRIKAARDDGEKTIYLDDLGSKTKRRAEKIKAHYDSLVARKNELIAAIRTQCFVSANQDELAGYVIPQNYSISDLGVERFNGKTNELICRRPVIIKGRVYDTDKKIFLIEASYKHAEGKWRTIKPQERATIFNARKLVELSNLGLPVTSQNAGALVTYLDCFFADNEKRLPMSYIVPRCGWHEFHDTKVFIDPRRDCDIEAEGKKITCAVSDASEFAKHLRTKGSIDEWRKAYQLAKKSPVARAVVAASVAAPLLDIVGERNFMLYLKARTRAGKTTAMLLGASAIGDEKIIRSFDSTKNGLVGAAADVNDFAFLIDEKQVADGRLKENLADLVYALGNGVGRTRLNRDSTLKKLHDWRTIAIASGETDLLPENATDGADTRLLTLHAPDTILSADDCKVIRGITKDNYGHALPLVIDEIKTIGKVVLVGMFNQMVDTYATKFKDMLPEHCRYMAVITLADALLNSALGVDTVTLPDGKKVKPSDDAIINLGKVFSLIPTAKDISATDHEKDFVRGFILQNQGKFIGGNIPIERMQAIYGKLRDDDGYTYITTRALQDACKIAGFDYRKLAADLAAVGFFEPADSVEKNRKNANNTVVKRFTKDSVSARCYRIQNAILDAVK